MIVFQGDTVLPHASLPQAIYAALRNAILNGNLRPGQALRQESLARQFASSRVPLREALNRLEAEGLVTLRPRRGFIVAALDVEEIGEIFQLRMLLEEHAGALATQARSRADVAAVHDLLGQLEAIEIDEPASVARWAALNRQFHTRLFESSRRRHVCNITNTLRDMVERYVRVEVAMTGDFERAQTEHRQIFAAFAEGDAERVGRLSREHCEHTAERLIGALKGREAGTRQEESGVEESGSASTIVNLQGTGAAAAGETYGIEDL